MHRVITRATVGRNSEYQEYIVRSYDQYGKRFPSADYYTDDRLDAYLTRIAMLYPPVACLVHLTLENVACIQHILNTIDRARKENA